MMDSVSPMRLVCCLTLAALCLRAQDWSLERLFTRPYLWGTPPSQLTWSKQGHTLVFLWNEEGRRFKDLYAYHPERKQLVRLTRLEHERDDLNLSDEEKDERQKQYLAPAGGLAQFDVARDGSRVAFAFKGDLYTVATDGTSAPFRLTRTKAGESNPQFSPDGRKLAYARAGQIHVQDLGNGQLLQVTDVEGGSPSQFRWSPDGRYIAYLVRKGASRTLPLPNYSGRLVTAKPFNRSVAGDEPEETTYFVVDLEELKPRAMEASSYGRKGYSLPPEWSPDSRRLLTRLVHASNKKQQFLVMDARSGKTKVVHEETDDRWTAPSITKWSPDGQWVLYSTEEDGWSHLYRVPCDGGKPQQITKGNWEVHNDTFSEDPQWIGDAIYYASTEPGPDQRWFYRIRPDGTGKELLSGRPGLNIGSVSEDGRYTVVLRADLRSPLDLYEGDHRITRSPRPEFSQYQWPDTRFFTFPARGDGKTVHAKMLLPPGYKVEDKSRQWPAVFFVHGAGYATSVLQQWGSYNDIRFAYNCYLAHKGYVVFDIDYRGSTGYGRAWRSDIYLHMAGPDLDDILGGVDYAHSLGNIDMKKLGIWGVSYGGFMTDAALFLAPGTFTAGAAWAAVNDWENYNAGYTHERLTTPAENPEAYRRSSPITFARNLKDHLLIIHGMVDDNVLFQDAVQLTERLVAEGKDFAHFYYPEESHAFVRDETWVDAFRRTTEWFDRYLR